MMPPHTIAIRQKSQQDGISKATRHTWRAEAQAKGQLLPDSGADPEGWFSRERSRLRWKRRRWTRPIWLNTVASARFTRRRSRGGDRLASMRTTGPDFKNLRTHGASGSGGQSRKKADQGSGTRAARKYRALAETAALRVLRKKASAIRGDEAQTGARQIRPSGGRLDAPIEDAGPAPHNAKPPRSRSKRPSPPPRCRSKGGSPPSRGARCGLEISDRSLRRWTKDGQTRADQRPLMPPLEPANKLSAAERAAVLAACNSKEFSSLQPCQIVPKRAETGRSGAVSGIGVQVLPHASRADGQQHHRGRAGPRFGANRPPATGPVRPERSGSGTSPEGLGRSRACSSASV
jgi:hypothetical protein